MPTPGTADLYERLGRKRIVVGDMQELQIEFLEALRDLWPHVLDRFYAIKNHKGVDRLAILDRIKASEEPVISKAQDYLKVLWLLRSQLEEAIIEAGEEEQEKVRERCANDELFFVNHFCYLHEPRMPEVGLLAKLPFIMYPAQERVFRDVKMAWEMRQDLLIEKSREAGITWSVSAYVLAKWRCTSGFTAIFASEKEEKVDFLGSQKPIFGKLRFMIYSLPSFLRPSSYEKQNGPNDNFRRLVNPDNGAEMSGEAGVNIGRSGRASMVIIDESQALQSPDAVDSALESVTNCRIDIGTPLGMNHFGQKRHSGQVLISTIGWEEDPRKCPTWRDNKKDMECAWRQHVEERRDPALIAQEYDRDYQASVEGVFIPSRYVMAAVDFDLPGDGVKSSGFDIAAGGKNESIYILKNGPRIRMPQVLPFKTSTEAIWAAIDQAEQDETGVLNYDYGGIGESLWGHLNDMNRNPPFRINGIDSAKPAIKRWLEDEGKFTTDKFRNRRAQMWWNVHTKLRKTFEHREGIRSYPAGEMLSLPNDPILHNQLSAPKKVYSGGKMGVESKKEMKTRGVKSPDRADTVILACADDSPEDNVVDQFDYRASSGHFADFEIDHRKMIGDSFASIYQAENMTTYVLCTLWMGSSRGLQVYGELISESGSPEEVIDYVRQTMYPEVKHIREWIANEEMFKNLEQGRFVPWRVYRKAGIKLKRNYQYHMKGSALLVNQMFRGNMIQLHRSCGSLFAELREWKRQSISQFGKTLGLVAALCQVVTRLRRLKQIYVEDLLPGTYGQETQHVRRESWQREEATPVASH